MNKLEKIICFIGGADLNILQKCPTDKQKFMALGIGVINTALLSMCTMGFAMYSIAKPYKILITNEINKASSTSFGVYEICLIIVFSIFWGLIIFGIDWGLISTIHKKERYNLKSGSILFLTTLFRLFVALIISFTVSKPLEVVVFKDYLPIAKREMQVDYQNKLNSTYKQEENGVRERLRKIENNILNITNEKQNAYENDPVVKGLKSEKELLSTQYSNLKLEYETLNANSRKKIESAQTSINAIQSSINQIKNTSIELSDAQQYKIISLENSKSNQVTIQRTERAEITRRNQELSGIESKITAKQQEINERYLVIDSDFDMKKADLDSIRKHDVIEKDSISKVAKIEYTTNANISQVFNLDNLINNIIAIGYLEKWNNDPKAELGEKEIAKKVSFVSLLLMVLIMIIDTAPIVIKLLVKRGCYEEEKEKIEKEYLFKRITDSIVFEKTYPNYASIINDYANKINELKALEKTQNDFNGIIESMRKKTFNDIERINREIGKVNNTEIRSVLSDFQNKFLNQLEITKNKMFELYNNFIDSIK